MKLSDCIIDFQLTGECGIDVGIAVKTWGKTTVLVETRKDTGFKWTLANRRAGVKVQIDCCSAYDLIDKLKLKRSQNPIFVRSASWRKDGP